MTKINNAVGICPTTALLKKAYLISVIAKSPPWGQSQNYKRLAQPVHRRELTTSLEILAESGIEGGDLAIFIIANLQKKEVAR